MKKNKERREEPYLSRQYTKEDEDKHSLESVGYGKQIGCQCGFMENMQHSKGPGGAKHKQQSHSTTGTGPDGNITDLTSLHTALESFLF